MSAFLGPIHIWLYNKIRNLESLELRLSKKDTPDVSMFLTKDLESVIDPARIHQSLQEMIATVETRFSKVVEELIAKDSFSFAQEVFYSQGTDDGTLANSRSTTQNLEGIYKSLNDFILEGMPCDTVNNMDAADDNHIKWHTSDALHATHWKDSNIYYTLRAYYIDAFVKAFDEAFDYNYTITDGMLFHEIKRRSLNEDH